MCILCAVGFMGIDSKSEHGRAVGLLCVTAVLWSFGGLLIKLISWDPMAIAGGRCILAAAVMLLLVRRHQLSWSFDQVGGAVCYAVNVVLFVVATKMTTAANAIFLQYTAPVYVAILGAYFLKEKVMGLEWLTVVAAIFGMALFFFDRLTFANYWGNGLAILAGVAFAGMIIFMRRQKSEFPLASIFLGNILAVIVCAPFMFGKVPDKAGWLALAALGILQLGLSYILYSIAIKRVTALEGIMVPIIEPILNPVWVFLFFGERPGRWAVPGGIIVLAAAAVCMFLRISKDVDGQES
jgi:drug/metabolite transporter (DMT)-like permease